MYIALGSCAELETQLTISKELSYINDIEEKALLETLNHISRMFMNLIKNFSLYRITQYAQRNTV